MTDRRRASLESIVIHAGCGRARYFANCIVIVSLALIIQRRLTQIWKVRVQLVLSIALLAGWTESWTDVKILLAVLFVFESFCLFD